MPIVYLITNKINNKKYVGADKNNNPKYFGSGLKIKLALKKHGKENFNKEIIEECDLNNLYKREKYWIKFYDAVVSNEFYNISEGGCGGNLLNNNESYEKWLKNKPNLIEMNKKRKGKTYNEIYGDNSEIEKEKRRLGQIGKQHTYETKIKMSESGKGRIPWNKGLTIDDKRVKKNFINRKRVICIKEYMLITPNGEILIFQGKKILKKHIKIINKNLNLKSKINIDALISKGQEKNYLITTKTIKNGKKFNN